MRVARVESAPFDLPFRAPFATAHGVERRRRGLLVRVWLEDGTSGLGEASPLPSFDRGDLAVARSALAAAGSALPGQAVAEALSWLDGLPSAAARFGLESALFDAFGRLSGCSVAGLLARGWPDRELPERGPVAEAIPVNATIGAADTEEAAAAARGAVEAGFGTVKLKVGQAASAAGEVDRVAAVRGALGPAARLRLDANEGWDVGRAISVLRACAGLDIELVEQPVAAADLAGLAAVRRAVAVPIAADEAVRDEAAARAVLAASAADLLVIKPTVVGGLRLGRRIAALAAAAGVGVVVTTALEAGVGIAAGLQLAASLAGSAGAPPRAHGLATASLLETDLLATPLAIRRGEMALPEGPGLGVELDPAALRRWLLPDARAAADRWSAAGVIGGLTC